jgi:hypothetical protein
MGKEMSIRAATAHFGAMQHGFAEQVPLIL